MTHGTMANDLFAVAIVDRCTALRRLRGYQVGSDSLYAPDVATVYVPMIESDSYRRDLGERLTEAVVKEIELKTPYKVVSTPDADSILSVELLGDTRHTAGGEQLRRSAGFGDGGLLGSHLAQSPAAADRAAANDRRCRRSWSASTRRRTSSRKRANRSPRRSSRPSSGWPSRSSARWKRRGRFAAGR